MGATGLTVYVGRAGERRGQGLRGRLGVYGRGRAPHSGLGEHALNRKLADVDFLRDRLLEAAAGTAATVGQWSVLAMEGLDIHVRWVTTADHEHVEELVIARHDPAVLWNR